MLRCMAIAVDNSIFDLVNEKYLIIINSSAAE